MSRLLSILSILLLSQSTVAQKNFWSPADSLHKTRAISCGSTTAVLWAGSMIGLHQVWYANVEKSKWHVFNDANNWMQMDKAGHMYTAYQLNKVCSGMFHWSGMKNKNSLLIGSGISIGYQTTLELFDAFSADWGFSWSDVAANSLGTGLYALQTGLWKEERIIPKFSYSPSKYAPLRPDVLGSSFSESLLKDYNGQTYWLSVSPGKFFKQSRFPKWICFSFGYSVDAKIQGDADSYIDYHYGTIYEAQREFLFSFDIDFSALPVRKPWLKVLVRQLNYLKVPFPALMIRDSKAYFRPFYF